jgi:dipeptidyl aminopeptidase/acylaminoacyl peptidase
MAKDVLPYGLWSSPIKPAMLSRDAKLEDVQWDNDGQTLVWHERRGGLFAKQGDDAPRQLSGDLRPRGGVGYGGGAYAVGHKQLVFASGGRLYVQTLGQGLPRPLTPEFGGVASPVISPNGQHVLFVHTYEQDDALALVPLDGRSWPLKLAQGADFYMQPAWHPDSQRLAWIEWNHPQMPWDGTRLKLARLQGNSLVDETLVAGDEDTPIFQPAFSPDGRYLGYIAGDGEWDRLYLLDLETGSSRVLVEGGVLAVPAWGQGLRTYVWSGSSSRVFYTRHDRGVATLWAVDAASGESEALNIAPYTWISQLSVSPTSDELAFIASAPKIPPRLIRWDAGQMRVEARTSGETLPPEDLSEPQEIQWTAPDGSPVYGLYYPPANSRFRSDEKLPPAIVNIHGGPTSAQATEFNADAAYWAGRGYGFLEVNYRGSTGYGRSYMLALRGAWGKVDVEDAIGGGQALVDRGLADPQRLVIMGGSAGGYTVLNALVRHPGFFRAGVNRYGVANLFIFETHKFELRYNDSLVGILPDDAERYRDWSPLNHADKIRDPLAVFQGLDDGIVPPSHSDQIVAALRANGVPHVYHQYEGEGHGFRKTETLADYCQTLEQFFLEHVLFV